MQNKTDKGTLLVSRSLPVANLNFVNRLFSARNNICHVYDSVKQNFLENGGVKEEMTRARIQWRKDH